MAQQPFTHPGAMPGHTGMAHGGQPMVHGHPSNQGVPGGGQPGVTMPQQIHPGMAVPGGPPVSQAGPMMAGMMPPGSGGPNAQAMAHLNPVVQNQFMAPQQQQQMSKSFSFSYLRNISQAFDPMPSSLIKTQLVISTITTRIFFIQYFAPPLKSLTSSGARVLRHCSLREDVMENSRSILKNCRLCNHLIPIISLFHCKLQFD